jgi:ABC-2 type transport system permease protein
VNGGFSLFVAFLVPLILVGITVPDSFAGERERHTLPTLLASRLSDEAILLGKVGTCVAFGWLSTVLVLVLSLISVNIFHWSGSLQFFALRVLVSDLAVSLLASLLVAAIGVLFSMRASTVQEAQQSTMGVLLVLPMVLQFGLMIALGSDSGRQWLRSTLGAFSFEQIMLIVTAFLVAIDAALVAAARGRFKRARLILSQ